MSVCVCVCVPQGSLREQLLYPKLLQKLWAGRPTDEAPAPHFVSNDSKDSNGSNEATPLLASEMSEIVDFAPGPSVPSDSELVHILEALGLEHLLALRQAEGDVSVCVSGATGLDTVADWAAVLSVGEQQRIAFARLLCHRCACSFFLCTVVPVMSVVPFGHAIHSTCISV